MNDPVSEGRAGQCRGSHLMGIARIFTPPWLQHTLHILPPRVEVKKITAMKLQMIWPNNPTVPNRRGMTFHAVRKRHSSVEIRFYFQEVSRKFQ